MRSLILSLLLLFFSLQIQGKEEAIVLNTPTGDIYGTIQMPKSSEPVPVVLLISGSGPTDRNGNQPTMQNNSLKFLSDGLMEKGIASLRFDKRGIGESQAAGTKEEDFRFDHYVDDVRLWADLLSNDSRFSSITIVGHSEGALIGTIASENNAHVKSVILIAGTALSADEIIKEQLEGQPEQVKEIVFPILEELKRGNLASNVPPMLYSLFRPSVQPYMISWMKYNPLTEIEKLTIPILIIQGSNDIQVSVNHADLLANATPKANKLIIEHMNHVLKQCHSKEQTEQMITYTNPDLPVMEEVITGISNFIF